jgi:hypothetical protein
MAVSTTWTSPVSATLDLANGALVSETNMDAIASNFYALGGTLGYIGCRAHHSANQSIPHAVNTVVALNSERFDSDPNGAMHDLATNNSRVTIRTTGVYHVGCCVSWATGPLGRRLVELLVNGSVVIARDDQQHASTTEPFAQTLQTVYSLTATDYVEIRVNQQTGAALNIEALAAFSPELWVVKV